MRTWGLAGAVVGLVLVVVLAGRDRGPPSRTSPARGAVEATRVASAPSGWLPPAALLFPPPTGARLARLLSEIEAPRDRVNTLSLPIPLGGENPRESLEYQERVYYRSFWAVEALRHAGPEVDALLLDLARTHPTWDTRCRAAAALLERERPEVTSVIRALLESETLAERYVAWGLAAGAAGVPGWGGVVPTSLALEALGASEGYSMAAQITTYLARAPDEQAVPALLARVEAGAPASHTARWALRRIGDREALERLAEASPDPEDDDLDALAALGTPEAIDALVRALDSRNTYSAVNALERVGGARALRGLEALLGRLEGRPETVRWDFDERHVRLAVLKLRHADDACPALMDVLEDRTLGLEYRGSAAASLRFAVFRAGAVHHARMAEIYKAETDPEIRWQFQGALEDSRTPGVTEAMLWHALTWSWPSNRKGRSSWKPLLHDLNRRLGTAFETLDDARAYAIDLGLEVPETPASTE